MRCILPCLLALFSLTVSCGPAWGAQFSHPDKGFELSLPEQWAEAVSGENVFVYHLSDQPATEPPLLVVRVQPFADAEDAARAASLGALLAADPEKALEEAASVRMKGFAKAAETLDPDTGAYTMEYTCRLAFHSGGVTGTVCTIPSIKGLFVVGTMADETDEASAAILEKAVADMDVDGRALVQGAGKAGRIMQAVSQAMEGRGLMLLLSLALTCLSLYSFFRFFRRDKTARTLIRHERSRREAAKEAAKAKRSPSDDSSGTPE